MSMINEFVEEIKTKINHKKEYHKNFYEKLGHKLNDNDLHKATQLAFDDCMEFINELAEKYRDVPDTNVGKWIPVSERLPELRQDCLVTVKYNGFSGMYGTWIKTGHLENDGSWWGDCCCGSVIAWQPLPEPYKGE